MSLVEHIYSGIFIGVGICISTMILNMILEHIKDRHNKYMNLYKLKSSTEDRLGKYNVIIKNPIKEIFYESLIGNGPCTLLIKKIIYKIKLLSLYAKNLFKEI